MIPYIDAHAHHQQQKTLEEAFNSGIQKIALGGTHPENWQQQSALQQKFPGKIFTHFGLHPWWIEKYSRAEIEKILSELEHKLPKADGLGETGLDFYSEKRDASRFDDQRFAFRAQIRMALKHDKPIVLHLVSAHDEAMKILQEENASQVPLIIHRFSGSVENAKAYGKLGAYLSFHDSKKWMKEVPLPQLLLETDSNEKMHPGGWDIRPHYQKTAEIMGLPILDLAQKVAENFARIGYARSP